MSKSDPLLESYIFEETQLTDQLETLILDNENSESYSSEVINEIFRIMHTIKGSSAMMTFNNISTLAHSVEDLFYFIRENSPENVDFLALSDLILESVDFIKVELEKVKNGDEVDGVCEDILEENKNFLIKLKAENGEEIKKEVKKEEEIPKEQEGKIKEIPMKIDEKNAFKAVIFFEEDCEMENLRAYSVVQNFSEVYYIPSDILENDETAKVIRENGFKMLIKSKSTYEEIEKTLQKTIFLKQFTLTQIYNEEELKEFKKEDKTTSKEKPKKENVKTEAVPVQNMISVNVDKLDKLMDLVGEIVIAEAMVVQNPDLKDLKLDNFQKSARQLHKIINEMQDEVMNIRMVPVSNAFTKMHRIVRDMSKKLNKEVQLKLVGEDTEVDKNVIEHIQDPLMHLVRNSVDHGIENPDEREMLGKNRNGVVTLEAKNEGNDVIVLVKDDGQGLNKDKILSKAEKNGILKKAPEDMTDKEIYNLVFTPGFSTNEKVTQFSGRGVGMDVVVKNIEIIGGSVAIDSKEGKGSVTTIKIPLTLAIIEGMNMKVGNYYYTIPLLAIKESFRVRDKNSIINIEGNEMLMVRGECYPFVRLHEFYNIKTDITEIKDGIVIMIGKDEKCTCIFVDSLIGQQQVVVKPLPNYIKKINKIEGITGCTLLGDGSISLIMDASWLINNENLEKHKLLV